MATLKKYDEAIFETIKENPLPKVPKIEDIGTCWIENILFENINTFSELIEKSVLSNTKEITLYSFSSRNLLEFYKRTTYLFNEHIAEKIINLSYKEILNLLDSSNFFKKFINTLERKGYSTDLLYNSFMDMKNVDLIIYLR